MTGTGLQERWTDSLNPEPQLSGVQSADNNAGFLSVERVSEAIAQHTNYERS